jgi:hypothetical protein
MPSLENGLTSRRTSPSRLLHGLRRRSAASNIATPRVLTIRHIEILGGWQAENIVAIDIPEIDHCLYARGHMPCAPSVARMPSSCRADLQALFEAGASRLDRPHPGEGALMRD